MGLTQTFNVLGIENILPVHPGQNLRKGDEILGESALRYFLDLAERTLPKVQAKLSTIRSNRTKGRVFLLLQEALSSGKISVDELADLLRQYDSRPDAPRGLLAPLLFSDDSEVGIVLEGDIERLKDRALKLGGGYVNALPLVHVSKPAREVRTCREYCHALAEGYFAGTNFAIKMSAAFEHQCTLLNALQRCKPAKESYLANVGVADLGLLPFQAFPMQSGIVGFDPNDSTSYQDRVSDGTLSGCH